MLISGDVVDPDLGLLHGRAAGFRHPAVVVPAQCQHLRSVSSGRIVADRGNLGAATIAQIRETIATMLDIPVRSRQLRPGAQSGRRRTHTWRVTPNAPLSMKVAAVIVRVKGDG
jgi:hypothetical protein